MSKNGKKTVGSNGMDFDFDAWESRKLDRFQEKLEKQKEALIEKFNDPAFKAITAKKLELDTLREEISERRVSLKILKKEIKEIRNARKGEKKEKAVSKLKDKVKKLAA